ncbi:flagellar filament capping protein FliD [Paraburkholderia hayleyella]|uniref:flagellar filament capping protein FliD n=1 Tax=Paraburkholderia hayleyella TaxID=2152889 RepID=UPI001291B764|nr:flagellar filament capping protein FliD [Paraburkholderia hayleyella]
MTTTTPSAADISSLLAQAAQSIISGSTKSTLDVDTLVASLVTARTAGQSSIISTKLAKDTATLSAIGTLKSALLALQTAVAGLSDGSTLSKLSATASGTGITASTTSGATAGNYAIAVTSVASANKISSQAFDSSTPLGSGTLTVALGGSGGKSMQVEVTAQSTLASIAASINASADNPGVTASVVTAADGQHLVVTSNATGAANTVSLTTSGTLNANLDSSTFSTVTAAGDAVLTIDGNLVRSASNSISGVLSGVTINLDATAATSPNNVQTLTLTNDSAAATTAISGFVTAYSAYVTAAKGLSSYTQQEGSTQKVAGTLLGDSMLQGLNGSLASAISNGVSVGGKTYSLTSIGINLQSDGTLKLDNDALKTALSSNSDAISALFNSTNGIGKTLSAVVTPYVTQNGILDTRTQALTADQKDLAAQAQDLTALQATLTDSYNKQFTALNTLMATMQNNLSYLTQLFGGANSAGTLATNK